MGKTVKIVITGGPCSGKTTALELIRHGLCDSGYTVLTVPETATELITGGVSPVSCLSRDCYQSYQLQLQLEKERIFALAAEEMPGPVVMVCDRGTLDNKAYMSEQGFSELLLKTGLSEQQLLCSYDAVFHLVTAAKDAVELYTTANNSARTETPEQAAAVDDRLLAAWCGHPCVTVLDNLSGFEVKMQRLVDEIVRILRQL